MHAPPHARLLSQAARIEATLVGHTGMVNAVKWIPSSGEEGGRPSSCATQGPPNLQN